MGTVGLTLNQGDLTPLQTLKLVLDGIWKQGLEVVTVNCADGRKFDYRREDLPRLTEKLIFNI